jgi:hypothetical protein
MTSINFQNHRFSITTLAIAIALFMMATIVTLALAKSDDFASCTKTRQAALKACRYNVENDFWTAIGNCNNLSDPNARAECKAAAKAARKEGKQLCREQLEARREVCELLGQAPYDPPIDPGNFVDPIQIDDTVSPNPYFPLIAGTTRR